jgi:hypothetical protein
MFCDVCFFLDAVDELGLDLLQLVDVLLDGRASSLLVEVVDDLELRHAEQGVGKRVEVTTGTVSFLPGLPVGNDLV